MGAHVSRDAGLVCRECPDAPEDGKSRCARCAAVSAERERARRAARKRKHLCAVCAETCAKDEAGKWLTTCERHRGTGWRYPPLPAEAIAISSA